ncbi:MAG TPA: hypothetical protein VMI54_22675 [Polyangiaceae bacterium]|nr:hypothetical protein [Polyangiaceae bacterium]
MKAPVVRRRSPWLEDVRIIYLGIWGFIRQCWLTLRRHDEAPR